jgi:inosine-uridine nucleoside N-ribohydrolase
MVKNWDDSMTVIKPHHSEQEIKDCREMIERIGKDNIGRQFTPADPATVLGYLYPEEFIKEKMPITINIHSFIDTQGKKQCMVETKEDSTSNIFVVEKVDLNFFKDKLAELMHMPEGFNCAI